MYLLNLKFLVVLFGSLLVIDPSFGQDSTSISLNHSKKYKGYKAVEKYKDGYIAVGTDGRIDRISVSGTIVKSDKMEGESFNCLLVDNKRIIIAGDHGTMLTSSNDETFHRLNSGTNKNISSLALFKGTIIASADDREILLGNELDSFRKIYPSVKGEIVSLSAHKSECFGVTSEGEIIHSKDGVNWDILDFNQVYAGYYKPCHFTKILVTDLQIAATGVHEDGSPVLLFSTQGNVWSDRPLVYTDDKGMQDFVTDRPNDMYYDSSRDLFYLACNNGRVMKIPSCSHCNKFVQLSSLDFGAISGDGETLMIVGENYCIKSIIPE